MLKYFSFLVGLGLFNLQTYCQVQKRQINLTDSTLCLHLKKEIAFADTCIEQTGIVAFLLDKKEKN